MSVKNEHPKKMENKCDNCAACFRDIYNVIHPTLVKKGQAQYENMNMEYVFTVRDIFNPKYLSSTNRF